MSISQKRLAETLGVSVATVSRVLNGKENVSPETRARVESLLRDSQYSPDLLARSLKTRRTHTIGILVPDITEVFFGAVIKSAVRFLETAGYDTLLCDSDENIRRERAYLDSLAGKRVEGILIASLGGECDDVRGTFGKTIGCGIPIVQIDNYVTTDCGAVLIENRRAGAMGIRHLYERGCRNIAVIAGSTREYTGRERLAGCREEAAKLGLELRVREGDFKERSGYDAMRSLLGEQPRPDAVFIHSSKMSYGAVAALRDAGLRYPDDLLVLTFDIRDVYGTCQPTLSSVVQPEAKIGALAAENLLAALDGEPARTVFLEPELLLRESC
ncbi:MAG: LacI family transcriptional regulator [Clostridiales bacterium]|nr:LacI family transcriptional regulator [Clostridiales bacterium]